MKDYYAILGVKPSASRRDIQAAWRRQAFRWHPDRHPSALSEAHRVFLDVGEAHAVLSDPDTRAAFDRQLAAHMVAREDPVDPGLGRPLDPSLAGFGEPLFREEAVIRQVMAALATADRRVRWITLFLRLGCLTLGFALWGLLSALLPEVYPPHGKGVVVLLLCSLTTALGWVLATAWKVHQAEAFRAYAEELVRRSRRPS